MKKTYTMPRTAVVGCTTVSMIAGSGGIKGPSGTGYGGKDNDGTKQPAARHHNVWDEEEEEE